MQDFSNHKRRGIKDLCKRVCAFATCVALCVVTVIFVCGTQANYTAIEVTLSKTVNDAAPSITKERVTQESEETVYILYYTANDAIDIAKLLWRECGSVESKTEQACVAWSLLNRVDATGESIYDTIRKPNQYAFSEWTQVMDDMLVLAYDVLNRWNDERNGFADVGRVLPNEYIYFSGDGVHNYFRDAFQEPYNIWDYSLNSPYEN